MIKKSNPINEDILRKTQAAMIIANTLNYNSFKSETPEQIIENAIAAFGELSTQQAEIVSEMLALAESVGLRFNTEMLKGLSESNDTSIMSPEDDMTEDEIDSMIENTPDDDFLEAYEDKEFAVVDDSGERINESDLNEDSLNEILQRIERIKARLRFAKTATKREMKTRIALHKHSSGKVLNKRARHMAIIAMKTKLARGKPLNKLQVSEKERIERMVARKKKLIDRIAMKMVPRVRKIEKDRLSHPTFTK